MQEFLRSFVLLLIFLSVVGGIYLFLLPEGGLSETAAAVLSAVTLVCALSPLFGLARRLQGAELSFSPSVETRAADPALLEDAGRETVERVIGDALRQSTDVHYRTELTVHIGEDYGIDIQRVRLVFARRFPEEAEAAAALRAALGIDPEIGFEAEECT